MSAGHPSNPAVPDVVCCVGSQVVRLLNALIGSGYHESGPPYMPLWPKGTAGFSMVLSTWHAPPRVPNGG